MHLVFNEANVNYFFVMLFLLNFEVAIACNMDKSFEATLKNSKNVKTFLIGKIIEEGGEQFFVTNFPEKIKILLRGDRCVRITVLVPGASYAFYSSKTLEEIQ